MAKRKESYLCKSSTLNIKKYLNQYYENLFIEGEHKFSHQQLDYILFDKGYVPFRRAAFKNINDEDVLCGRIILVRDDYGNVAPYIVDVCLKNYCTNNTKEHIKKFSDIRRQNLRELGYDYDDFGQEVVKLDTCIAVETPIEEETKSMDEIEEEIIYSVKNASRYIIRGVRATNVKQKYMKYKKEIKK